MFLVFLDLKLQQSSLSPGPRGLQRISTRSWIDPLRNAPKSKQWQWGVGISDFNFPANAEPDSGGGGGWKTTFL